MVGRCKNGDPLVAEKPNGSEEDPKNNFLYYYEDRSGLQCPIGAHIRRANPRDSLGPDPETALRLSKMHRIIRRGRPYGERWDPDAANADAEKAERGMLFIALNADIAGTIRDDPALMDQQPSFQRSLQWNGSNQSFS